MGPPEIARDRRGISRCVDPARFPGEIQPPEARKNKLEKKAKKKTGKNTKAKIPHRGHFSNIAPPSEKTREPANVVPED